MKNLFITFEQSQKIKSLGFNEPCLGFYDEFNNNTVVFGLSEGSNNAPTYQQAFKFIRDKYDKNVVIFSDGFQWTFDLRWKDEQELSSYPGVKFPKKEIDRVMFDTYEDAESTCLDKLIEIISDNKTSSNSVKHIVKKTHYWIFKKTNEDSKYYYVRTFVDGLNKIIWFMGYENQNGTVSSVGGELSENIQKELENEYQQSLN